MHAHKIRCGYHAAFVVYSHATNKPIFIQMYLLIQVLPMVELEMLHGPIVAAPLASAAPRQEPGASHLDQILLGNHLANIIGGDAPLELVEDILAARMGQYVLVARELRELLARRLSTIHFALVYETTTNTIADTDKIKLRILWKYHNTL
ncbi:hypothetical protein N9L19_00995 [bacterium]|nr:hypothetical protein [bacterium]